METLFFYFLRRGLWETEEEYKGSKAIGTGDWERLFAMAHEQAVTGWLIDGVGRTAMRPARNVWEQWLFHLLYLEQMNRLAERCGQQWLERLEKAGMPAFVFKGTSVALWYQQPLHRSPGDVDVVLKDGWSRLKPMLAEAGIAFRDENGDIVVQEDGRAAVELHARWEYVYNPVVNARLQRLCKEADETDRELYLVCLMLHIRRHFLTYGIGLKQVCDVAVMLRHAELDGKKVAILLKRLHVERFGRILFGFIENYIGGTEAYPLKPVRRGKGVELFRNVVLKDGYRLKMEREEKARNMRFRIGCIVGNAWFWGRRGWTLLGIMPGEVMSFLAYKAGKRIFRHG